MTTDSKKKLGIAVGILIALGIICFIAMLLLRIDSAEAERIALEQSGGGEIIAREVSNEGLWNEYSYRIQKGDTWYEIEISGFGRVMELESGVGTSWR